MVPGKLRLDGLALTIGPGATPVPESGIVLVMPEAVTVRLPLREPAAVGANLTLTVHEAPAAIDVPQELVCEKSPVVGTEEPGAGGEPDLVPVTDGAALVEPVATVPKPTAVGLIE